jgi:hypothetical protein
MVDPMGVCACVCCRSIPSFKPPGFLWHTCCRGTDSVAAKVRVPRQERIRATHRQQQAVAAQAREARHGGGTSFWILLVYDDSDHEGHDTDLDAAELRSSTSDDSDADARGNLRDFVICSPYTFFFSSLPLVHLSVWHGAIEISPRLMIMQDHFHDWTSGFPIWSSIPWPWCFDTN